MIVADISKISSSFLLLSYGGDLYFCWKIVLIVLPDKNKIILFINSEFNLKLFILYRYHDSD